MARSAAVPLYPYQQRWIEDDSRFKLIVKSTQTGFSFASSLEAVLDAVNPASPGGDWIVLSRGDRQSLEFAQKAKDHCKALEIAGETFESTFFEETLIRQHVITFANGRRLIALPANPDTARGYTGNMVLDEFAFHKDDMAIWRAAFGRASRGGLKVRVISTPNGTRGKYFELAKELGLTDGVQPVGQPVKRGAWSGHWCDVFLAVAEGCPLDPEEIRQGLDDEDGWQQEYCCIFLSDAANYIPMELIAQAVSSQCALELDEPQRYVGPLFFGYDVARKRDLAVLIVVEQLGDTYWMRQLLRLKRQRFAVQKDAIREAAEISMRGCIDATGMGAQIAEEMAEEFPGKVEPVTFTAPVKQHLVQTLKGKFEERQVRIPDDRDLRRAINAVKKFTTVAGNVRYDADRTDKGHADELWALALAIHAADSGAVVGKPDYVSSGVLMVHAQAARAY